mgnify:CR=1 FL=1
MSIHARFTKINLPSKREGTQIIGGHTKMIKELFKNYYYCPNAVGGTADKLKHVIYKLEFNFQLSYKHLKLLAL